MPGWLPWCFYCNTNNTKILYVRISGNRRKEDATWNSGQQSTVDCWHQVCQLTLAKILFHLSVGAPSDRTNLANGPGIVIVSLAVVSAKEAFHSSLFVGFTPAHSPSNTILMLQPHHYSGCKELPAHRSMKTEQGQIQGIDKKKCACPNF